MSADRTTRSEQLLAGHQGASLVSLQQIQGMIVTIRGVQVMLDRDLANIYGVENKRLNEQVKRNIERFPESFRFQLSHAEKEELVANCDRFASLKHATSNPYAFTEQGVSMLSAVLRSDTAVKVSIQIINAFVEMRRFLQANASMFARLDSVEKRQLVFESKVAENFEKVFQALEAAEPPRQGIFYDGQVYDAQSDRSLSSWKRAGVRVPATPEWENAGGEGFRLEAENEETPGPLNRKQSRKGSRGQRRQHAGAGGHRQTIVSANRHLGA